ncbi:MAG: DUF3347 domain-containing protein [Cyclobacteriaceae bacterium]
MKTRSKSTFFAVLFAATAIAFITNCSGKKDDGGHSDHETTEDASGSNEQQTTKPRFEVDRAFQKQMADVFSSYVDLKNALVSSDAGKVREEATDTEEVVAKVDMKLLSGAAHNDWMNYLTPIQSSLKDIQASDDIEAQRRAFSALSENLYKNIKAFGLGGDEAYYTYCPMAFDNQGAFWLSENDEISNPYFGDKMLKCGEVKEKLQ